MIIHVGLIANHVRVGAMQVRLPVPRDEGTQQKLLAEIQVRGGLTVLH